MRDRIEEPMLAVDVKLEEIKYPALASRKLDGVRALRTALEGDLK
jgi:hypothetical protein